MKNNTRHIPHPFVKWAGGKRQLISKIEKFIPKKYNNFIEPFVGGGALFFHLNPPEAILIDNNKELINCYNVIKTDLVELIKLLKQHKNEEAYYYKIREVDRYPEEFNKLSDTERASRTIYMNRCCYNGLYRVNSKGFFNVPFGRYKKPRFCDEDNLNAVHEALKNAKIIWGNFEECLQLANKGDLIYFDPPYHPLSETANFTSYTKDNFGKDSQKRLFEVFDELNHRGCKLILSNSYNEFILKLYENYRIIVLNAKRAINSDPNKRGEIKEVLVLNELNSH